MKHKLQSSANDCSGARSINATPTMETQQSGQEPSPSIEAARQRSTYLGVCELLFVRLDLHIHAGPHTDANKAAVHTRVDQTQTRGDRSCLGIESKCRTSRRAWSSFISTTCTHTHAFSSNADENRTEVAHRGSHTSDKGRRTRKAARALILTRIQSHTSAALAFCSAAICAATACTRHQFSGPHKDRDGSAG